MLDCITNSFRTTAPTTCSTGHMAFFPQEVFERHYKAVHQDKILNYFGTWHKLTESCLSLLAKEAFTNVRAARPSVTPRTVEQQLQDFLTIAYTDCSSVREACWFLIRMTRPRKNTKVPRWHQDGKMFDLDDNGAMRSRYVMTLLGPTTMFIDLPLTSETLEYMQWIPGEPKSDWIKAQLEGEGDESIYRRKVDKYFRKKGFQRIRGELGQVVKFSRGHIGSPVHSEPDMSGSDRIFVSVIFGSSRELKIMAKVYRGVAFEE